MGDPTQETIVAGNNPDLVAAANAAIEANAKAQAETSEPDIETETETETETTIETAAPEANVETETETIEAAAPTNGAANTETAAIEAAAEEVAQASKEIDKKIKQLEKRQLRLRDEAYALEATATVAGANKYGNVDYTRSRVLRAGGESGSVVNALTGTFVFSIVAVFGLEALASYLDWADSFFLVRWFSEPMDTFVTSGVAVWVAYCLALSLAVGGVVLRRVDKPKDNGHRLRNSAPWAFNIGCVIAGLALAHPVIEVFKYLVG